MIKYLNKAIKEASDKEEFYKVIDLANEALSIPNFGFTMETISRLGYSLIRVGKIAEGINLLQIIINKDTNDKFKEYTSNILKVAERLQQVQLPLKKYLEQGNILQEGVVIYLKDGREIAKDSASSSYLNSYMPYMVWKIEDNKVYGFPVKKYDNHGMCLRGHNYLIFQNCSVKPELVSFKLSDISKVYFEINKYDYQRVIRDLYERFCVFGSISNVSKNHFVTEMEQTLNIEIGNLIVLYNPQDRVRHYYYVMDIDTENGIYKCIQVTHRKGNITIKDEQVKEIPMSAYIMEKIPTTLENREKMFR